jgi:hypothetical protein
LLLDPAHPPHVPSQVRTISCWPTPQFVSQDPLFLHELHDCGVPTLHATSRADAPSQVPRHPSQARDCGRRPSPHWLLHGPVKIQLDHALAAPREQSTVRVADPEHDPQSPVQSRRWLSVPVPQLVLQLDVAYQPSHDLAEPVPVQGRDFFITSGPAQQPYRLLHGRNHSCAPRPHRTLQEPSLVQDCQEPHERPQARDSSFWQPPKPMQRLQIWLRVCVPDPHEALHFVHVVH